MARPSAGAGRRVAWSASDCPVLVRDPRLVDRRFRVGHRACPREPDAGARGGRRPRRAPSPDGTGPRASRRGGPPCVTRLPCREPRARTRARARPLTSRSPSPTSPTSSSTLGNHDEAEALARESLEIGRRLGDDEATGIALLVLGASLLERGREAEAAPLIVESVRMLPERRLQGLPRLQPGRAGSRPGRDRPVPRSTSARRLGNDPCPARAGAVPVGGGVVRAHARSGSRDTRRLDRRRGARGRRLRSGGDDRERADVRP